MPNGKNEKKVEQLTPRLTWESEELPHLWAHAGVHGTYCGPGQAYHRCLHGYRSNGRNRTITVEGRVPGEHAGNYDSLVGARWDIKSYDTVIGRLFIEKDRTVRRTDQFGGLKRLYVISCENHSMTTTRLQRDMFEAVPNGHPNTWESGFDKVSGIYVAAVPHSPSNKPELIRDDLRRALVVAAKAIVELEGAKPAKPKQLREANKAFDGMIKAFQVLSAFTVAKYSVSCDYQDWLKIGQVIVREDRNKVIESWKKSLEHPVAFVERDIKHATVALLPRGNPLAEALQSWETQPRELRRLVGRLRTASADYESIMTHIPPAKAKTCRKLPEDIILKGAASKLELKLGKTLKKWLTESAQPHADWRAWKLEDIGYLPEDDKGVARKFPIHTPLDDRYYLLRAKRKGSRILIETSSGVDLVVSDAEARKLLEIRTEAQAGAKKDTSVISQVGPYTITGMHAGSGLGVGCHFFTWAEIEIFEARIKDLLNVKETE